MSIGRLPAMSEAVIEALAMGPLSKAELAHRLEVRPTVLAGCIATLAGQGRVIINNGLVGLPGQLPWGEPKTEEELLYEQFRALWQQRGIVTINPADVADNFLRERLSLIGLQMYGRRGLRE